MEGILIIAHGSRAKETEATLENILDMVRSKLQDTPIEHAFMEFSDRTIESGVKNLVNIGVSEIRIVPYFLFMGIHLKENIPDRVKKCMPKYSDIKITMGEPLGVDKRLADIIIDRVNYPRL